MVGFPLSDWGPDLGGVFLPWALLVAPLRLGPCGGGAFFSLGWFLRWFPLPRLGPCGWRFVVGFLSSRLGSCYWVPALSAGGPLGFHWFLLVGGLAQVGALQRGRLRLFQWSLGCATSPRVGTCGEALLSFSGHLAVLHWEGTRRPAMSACLAGVSHPL